MTPLIVFAGSSTVTGSLCVSLNGAVNICLNTGEASIITYEKIRISLEVSKKQ